MTLRTINKVLNPSYSISGTEDEDTDLRSLDKKDLQCAAKEWIDIYYDRLEERRRELKNIRVISVSTDMSMYNEELDDNIIVDENVVKWIKYFFDIND